MGVSVHEWICMHINVGCALAELLAQTGYENGTVDGCVPTAAATRPAAARLPVNLKTLHKARVKEISERVAHTLNVFLTFFGFCLCVCGPALRHLDWTGVCAAQWLLRWTLL